MPTLRRLRPLFFVTLALSLWSGLHLYVYLRMAAAFSLGPAGRTPGTFMARPHR